MLIPHSRERILYIIPLKYFLAIDSPGILSDIKGHRYIARVHEQAYIIEEVDRQRNKQLPELIIVREFCLDGSLAHRRNSKVKESFSFLHHCFLWRLNCIFLIEYNLFIMLC